MPDHVALAATAKRLIEANGRTVTVRRLDRTITDPSKPWRGTSDPRATPNATASVKAAFVDPSSAASMGLMLSDPNLVASIDSVALIAATSTVADLATFDEVVDGSLVLKIDNIDVLKPGDVKMLYVLRLVGTGNTLSAP